MPRIPKGQRVPLSGLCNLIDCQPKPSLRLEAIPAIVLTFADQLCRTLRLGKIYRLPSLHQPH